MSYSVIKFKRGSRSEWSQQNPILADGEFVVEYPDEGVGTGFSKFKLGDGQTKYNDLPYCLDGAAVTELHGGNASTSSLIQIRADTELNWRALDPIIQNHEYVFTTDKKGFKMGDGKSNWSALPYLEFGCEWDTKRNVILNYGDEG